MKCERCGNENELYFGLRGGKKYCRKCISFRGEKAKSTIKQSRQIVHPFLDYPLSFEQEKISNEILNNFINKKNIFLHAVCGAGKTELLFKTIAYCLSNNLQVGISIPRRDVVIELVPRLQKAFPTNTITAVYGGNASSLEGDIILLTAHQLYRYPYYFDFLVMDETDAFPFANNEVLNEFFYKAVRGNYLLMSATPYKYIVDKVKEEGGVVLSLYKRYHNHPLIVPSIKLSAYFMDILTIKELRRFLKDNKPVFIFAPTIYEAEKLFSFIKFFAKNGAVVHSKSKERDKIISSFKEGKLMYLVTTSILERGVTIKNLQVIVYNASSSFFTSKTLEQIAGRVGRKIDAYEGEVIYIAKRKTIDMEESIENIKRSNKNAFM